MAGRWRGRRLRGNTNDVTADYADYADKKDTMLYNSGSRNQVRSLSGVEVLGANVVDAYARYLPQQAPANPVTIAIVGGSLALVAVVLVVKHYKGKKKGKKK